MRPSIPTIAAAAVLVYAVSNVAHEGLGHGLACEALGGRLLALNAVYCECDAEGMSEAALRAKAAAGSIANLVVAAAAGLGLRARSGRARGVLDLVLWLLLTVNLLQPAGYLLFSGVVGIGDWDRVVGGSGQLRALLAIGGGLGYLAAIQVSLRWLTRFVGAEPDRQQLAVRLTVVPWLTGGALYVAAGLLNPIGIEILLASALAAGFGGTSGLAWMAQLLHDERRWAVPLEPLTVPERPVGLWAAAGLAAVGFVAVLGPTVTLAGS
jgi:hypothetical protein